jgi:EF hand domain-containing protein
LLGCSGQPSRIAGVKIDVQHAAERIMAEFDKDQNGSLSQEELAAVPAVNVNRKWYDADKNGQISQEELRKGLRDIFDPKDGLLSVVCEVTRNGQPLSGAVVKFVPMPELDGAIPPATGVSDKHGSARLTVADDDRPKNTPPRIPVVRPGLYLVEVTHDQIKIPEEYNSKTKIGKEVSGFTTAGGAFKIQLKF